MTACRSACHLSATGGFVHRAGRLLTIVRSRMSELERKCRCANDLRQFFFCHSVPLSDDAGCSPVPLGFNQSSDSNVHVLSMYNTFHFVCNWPQRFGLRRRKVTSHQIPITIGRTHPISIRTQKNCRARTGPAVCHYSKNFGNTKGILLGYIIVSVRPGSLANRDP